MYKVDNVVGEVRQRYYISRTSMINLKVLETSLDGLLFVAGSYSAS
jgi:hypothetical protein